MMNDKHTNMKNLLITCMLFFLFLGNAIAQQKVEVTSVVTDVSNEPLIGVNISVSDLPGFGTITDIDGRYKISVDDNRKLIFSYIGFETVEVLVGTNRQINVTMNEATTQLMDELVVTGTGAQGKLTVTGAVTSVNVEELKSAPTSSIVNTLAGRVPGIMAMQTSGQPGKNFSEFWIRGISTFGANTSAYVLVDGFERDLNEINIEDIESFSVLKDASATAIYGSKGANGVILITTKHGKPGKINFDAKVETSYNTRTITPKFADGISYANLMNEARVTRNNAPIYQPEELEILRLGLDPDLYPNVDWQDKLLKDGAMSYRANINMSGGGATARYFVSASYIEDQGMYYTDESLRKDYDTNANYKRYNYRLNTDINITERTVLKVGVSGSLQKRNSPGLGDSWIWEGLFGYSPIRTPIYYSNGYIPAVGKDNLSNPWITSTQTGYNENWTNNIQTNVSLEHDFRSSAPGLRFVGRFGYDTNNTSNIMRQKSPEQWYAERARNVSGEIVFHKVSDQKEMNQSSSSSGNRREFFDFMLTYNRMLGYSHNIGADVKYTQDSYIYTVNLGDDIKNGIPKRNQSLAGRATYNWKYRYFLDFNFGYTGSENFAKGHQYGFFPAYSVAWNVANESFIMNNFSRLDMFKIRYSYGRVGNDNLGNQRFPYLSTIAGPAAGYEWAEYGNSKEYKGLFFAQVASP